MTQLPETPPNRSHAGAIINTLIALAGAGGLYFSTENQDAIAPTLSTAQSNGIVGGAAMFLMAVVHWLSRYGIFDLIGQLFAAWLTSRLNKFKPRSE